MEALDTNVLIRILVDDKKQMDQVKAARQFAKKAGQLFIAQIVQVELVWVLETAYDIPKNEIIQILKHLHENEVFTLQNERQYGKALHIFQTTSADFSDCLIWAECQEQHCDVITFDKKFSRLANVKLIAV